jgi:hypothetical protein
VNQKLFSVSDFMTFLCCGMVVKSDWELWRMGKEGCFAPAGQEIFLGIYTWGGAKRLTTGYPVPDFQPSEG